MLRFASVSFLICLKDCGFSNSSWR